MEAKKNSYTRISKDDALVCFVDHQTGLFSLVQDFSPEEFKNSILALAATAALFKLPVILTTSFEQGPNGPLIPDLKKMFPSAPYIPRPGQINAWDNEDFVNAIKKTGKNKLFLLALSRKYVLPFPRSQHEKPVMRCLLLLTRAAHLMKSRAMQHGIECRKPGHNS